MHNPHTSQRFFEIVNFNNLEDLVIPIAAEDPELRGYLEHRNFGYTSLLSEERADELSELYPAQVRNNVRKFYGLSHERMSKVMNICLQDIAERKHNVE